MYLEKDNPESEKKSYNFKEYTIQEKYILKNDHFRLD